MKNEVKGTEYIKVIPSVTGHSERSEESSETLPLDPSQAELGQDDPLNQKSGGQDVDFALCKILRFAPPPVGSLLVGLGTTSVFVHDHCIGIHRNEFLAKELLQKDLLLL